MKQRIMLTIDEDVFWLVKKSRINTSKVCNDYLRKVLEIKTPEEENINKLKEEKNKIDEKISNLLAKKSSYVIKISEKKKELEKNKSENEDKYAMKPEGTYIDPEVFK